MIQRAKLIPFVKVWVMLSSRAGASSGRRGDSINDPCAFLSQGPFASDVERLPHFQRVQIEGEGLFFPGMIGLASCPQAAFRRKSVLIDIRRRLGSPEGPS